MHEPARGALRAAANAVVALLLLASATAGAAVGAMAPTGVGAGEGPTADLWPVDPPAAAFPRPTPAEPQTPRFAPQPLYLSNGAAQNFSPYAPAPFIFGSLSLGPNLDGFNIANLPSIAVNQTGNLTVGYNGTWSPAPGIAPERDWVLAILVRNGQPQVMALEANTTVRVSVNASSLPFTVYFGLPSTSADAGAVSTARVVALPPGGNLTVINLTSGNAGISLTGNTALAPALSESIWLNASGSYPGNGVLSGPQTLSVLVPADGGLPLELRAGRISQWTNASHFPGGRFLTLKGSNVVVLGGSYNITAWTRGSPESSLYLNATVTPANAFHPDNLSIAGTVGNRSLDQTTSWNVTTTRVLSAANYDSVDCSAAIRLNNGSYRLFCSWLDTSGGGTSAVESALSPDGRNWAWEPGTRYSLCGGQHEILHLSIVKLLDGTLRMYYGGSDPLLACGVSLGTAVHASTATSTNEGVTWTLETETITGLTVTAPSPVAVVPTTDGRLRMYMDSNSGTATAISDDGVNWAYEATLGGSVPRQVFAMASGGYKMYTGTSTVQSRISANGFAWSGLTTEVAQWGIGAIAPASVLDRGDGYPLLLIYSQSDGLFTSVANQSAPPSARVDITGRLSDGLPFGANGTTAGSRGSFQLNATVPVPASLGRFVVSANAGFGENRFRGLVLNRMPQFVGPNGLTALEDVPLLVNLSLMGADPDPADTLSYFAFSPYWNQSTGTLLYPNGVLSDTLFATMNDGHDNVPFTLPITVTPVDDPPQLNLNASYPAVEDEPLLLPLGAAATDEETPGGLTWATDLQGGSFAADVLSVTFDDGVNVTATISVSDGNTVVNGTTIFVVEPRDDPPVLTLAPTYSFPEDSPIAIDLLTAVFDEDTPLDAMVLTTNLSGATVEGTTLFLNRSDPGTEPFNVTLSDGSNTTVGTSVLLIGAVNDPPAWINVDDLSGLDEDVAFLHNLLPHVVDPDTEAGALQFTDDSPYATISGGELQLLFPEGVTSATITLTVSDGESAVPVTFNVTINPVNDAPALSNEPPANFTGNGSLQFQFNVSDPDNAGGFTFEVQSNESWITITPAGVLTFTPPVNHGRFEYQVRVTDSGGATSGYLGYTIVLATNSLPEMEPSFEDLPADARVAFLFSAAFNVSDADGDPITASLAGVPGGQPVTLVLTSANRYLLSWTPTYPGTLPDPFVAYLNGTLVLNDTFGESRFDFAIRAVNPPNLAPDIFSPLPIIEGAVGTDFHLDLSNRLFDNDSVDEIDDLQLRVVPQPGTSFVSWNYSTTTHILTVHFNANGTGAFLLILSDPGHLSDQEFVTVRTPVAVGPPPPSDFPWWLLLLVAAAGVGAGLVLRNRMRAVPVEPTPSPPPAAERTTAPKSTPAARPPVAAPVGGRKRFLVEDVFLLYRDGRTIFTRSGLGADAVEDPESVGSMLIAVQEFVKDSFRKGSPVDRMGYGDNVILLTQGDHTLLAVTVFGEPDAEFRDLLQETVRNVEASYAGVIEAWSGNRGDFVGVETVLSPIWGVTAHLTRGDVLLATIAREVQMLSGIEFFQGFVRLKVGVVNNTPTVITNVTVDLDFNQDVLRLHKVEPSGYKTSGAKVNLGVLQSGEKATLAYYFDPQICTQSMVDGTARYKDAEGAQHVVQMKSRKAEVVCPLFFTKEQANTAVLRRLVETELNQFDVRAYDLPGGLKGPELAGLFEVMKGSVLAHDVQSVRVFESHNPYTGEGWFYGKTQVKGYQMVIRALVDEEKGRAEFFVASSVMRAVTGLLAELNHTFAKAAQERLRGTPLAPLFDESVRSEYADLKAVSKMIEGEADAGETESP